MLHLQARVLTSMAWQWMLHSTAPQSLVYSLIGTLHMKAGSGCLMRSGSILAYIRVARSMTQITLSSSAGSVIKTGMCDEDQ